ncbi:unnamed protein product [Echinostoma caproni]|uniref:BZIP domain-containing protein n=1 Tax=Echinostoma caproni TaxID=27848 RepID=A0A183ANX2_9TREM|nr:unnamed protein product [Echinostoma caproni]
MLIGCGSNIDRCSLFLDEFISSIVLVDQVGDDEARRRAKRRERNRVAAAKCRQRRQDQIMELQHRVSLLNKTGQELHSSIQSLNEERARLKELIRQHGLAGCSAADEFLASLAASNDLTLKEEETVGMETGENEEEMNLEPSGAFGSTDDIMMTNAAPYSNSGPTTSCSSPTSPASRTAQRPDSELTDVGQRVVARLEQQQRLLRPNNSCTQIVSINGTITTIKPDQYDVPAPSPADSGSDGSDSRQMRTASQSSCHSPPTTKTRLVVARPCTLLPPKCTLESANTSADSTDSNHTTLMGSVVNTTNVSTGTTTAATPTSLDTPIMSRIWPSELHYFSPILTPSAWKVIPKDCGSGSVTPSASTPTGTTNSTVANSSVAAAAAALFLSSPSLTSSLTNPGSTANLLVSSFVNSIQTAAAAAAAAAAGGTVLTTPSTGVGDQLSAVTANSGNLANTPLFCLPEVIGAPTTTASNQTSFVLSPLTNRDRTEQHASEELNATITQ